ncbi:MAG: S4 domain-containing protein [Candidatus Accumulibacter sp. UW20]|jgi:23S rRNA pseudouridine2604 synthase
MPRSTLKLPKRSAADAASEPRSAVRRPIRGGAPTAKHAAPRRSDASAAADLSPAGKSGQNTGVAGGRRGDAARTRQRETGSGKPENVAVSKPAAAAGGGKLTVDRTRDENRPAERTKNGFGGGQPVAEGTVKRARSYPQRGIARSTGARAFPPAPLRSEPPLTPPESVRRIAPAVAAEQPGTLPAEAPVAAVVQRGPARELPRLSRLVSELAECSRREADEWIENGWVSVDGVIITRLGARVSPKAKIQIKEAARRRPVESVTILFNKPLGDLDDPAAEGSEAVSELIRADNHWADDGSPLHFRATHLRGLALAGRLDGDAGGMLVFTQEGSVARRLTGADAEKEYHVRVEGELLPAGLELLRHGLSLDKVKLLRAQVSWLNEQQLRFVLHEDRKRQIRSMCELVGLRVTSIKRVRIGSVSLARLPSGQWRYLRPDERF